ncbi:MAG TPA: efflux RND transporter periplasmic adaptor subunit [Gammaproteobacteria bacterium]|nr:efflux RND transporter periplasmic adaptor subunit [Gammaproteobacteria bacterium]
MSQEEQAEKEPQQAADPRKRKRRLALTSLAAIFVVAGATYGVYWAMVARYRQSTDDAYVAGNRVAVMPQEKGTVVAILADDTTRVHRGQLLVQLDDSNARIALQRAKAQLAAKVREINTLYASEKQLQAEVAKQQATLNLARNDYARDKDMHRLGYFPTKNLEHSATLVAVNKRSLAAAKQALQGVRARLGNTGVADNPAVRLAAAQVRAAWLALQRTRIVAPVSGRIAKRSVQVGEQVQPGLALMAIVPLHQLWIEANFKESQVGSIRIGQPVTMNADVYGDAVTFHGQVIGVGAGTGSAFSLLPPQNATGNWIKVVQRVPVRIAIAKADLAQHALRIGLSMDVTVETGHGAHGIAGALVDPGTYQTPVYDTRAAGAKPIIARIIRDNTMVDELGRVAASDVGKKADHGE